MSDMEKVIKGIESCEPNVFKRVCRNCPYNGDANCGHVLWNDALALLKEQTHGETFTVIDTKTGKETDE